MGHIHLAFKTTQTCARECPEMLGWASMRQGYMTASEHVPIILSSQLLSPSLSLSILSSLTTHTVTPVCFRLPSGHAHTSNGTSRCRAETREFHCVPPTLCETRRAGLATTPVRNREASNEMPLNICSPLSVMSIPWQEQIHTRASIPYDRDTGSRQPRHKISEQHNSNTLSKGFLPPSLSLSLQTSLRTYTSKNLTPIRFRNPNESCNNL